MIRRDISRRSQAPPPAADPRVELSPRSSVPGSAHVSVALLRVHSVAPGPERLSLDLHPEPFFPPKPKHTLDAGGKCSSGRYYSNIYYLMSCCARLQTLHVFARKWCLTRHRSCLPSRFSAVSCGGWLHHSPEHRRVPPQEPIPHGRRGQLADARRPLDFRRRLRLLVHLRPVGRRVAAKRRGAGDADR